MNKKQFGEQVNQLGRLSGAEQLIVCYFSNNYTALPFAKMDDLCKQIGVGKATLGRFLNRLGFGGFIDFKKCVSDDLVQVLSTPIDRCMKGQSDTQSGCVLIKHYQEVILNIEETFEGLSHQDFETTVDKFKDDSGKLYVIGSASAEPLANYFYLLARYLRKEVVLIKADPSILPHQLVDVTDKDTLFAISYHRYSNITLRLVKWFKEHGGNIIVLTDQPVNPFVSYADILFSVGSQSEGIFNNRTSGLFLVEALIKGVSNVENKENRFSRMENIFGEFNFFKTS
ncbi:MurR/RpiR family transcriptional regulator [Vibrio scophthalmi]|uniref:HTH-type transcriptional regulator HexR n=1 Tax=Vibrio scophthalmi TaxID=45658 RepID=A0A1E3WM92_9VIBR|nr:MurR/RpiR family transcriptional regulator [Vibrio scophthalmi]ODS10607.1 hypothetical protein VSF3289_00866 [Vibrio scophthalmi]